MEKPDNSSHCFEKTPIKQAIQNGPIFRPCPGTIRIALTWDPVPDDGDAIVSGYKVLVNGEKYGFVLHSQVYETEIKVCTCIKQTSMHK